MHYARYMRLVHLILKVPSLMTNIKTGWGTRAGIGDPTAATKAAADASNEKLQEAARYRDISPSNTPLYEQYAMSQSMRSRLVGNHGYQQSSVELQGPR
jgi:hypothetical protein